MSGDRRCAAFRLLVAALGATLVAALVAGCVSEPPPPAPSATATDLPQPTAVVTRSQLATTVWYAGYTIELGSAVATLDAKGGTVTVAAIFHNLGADTNGFDVPVRLLASGRRIDSSRDTTVPDLAQGESGPGTFVFAPSSAIDLATASIVIGRDGDHQAVVPFLPGTSAVIDLKPVAPPIPAKASTTGGTISLTITGAELRADLPDWGDELPASTMALTFSYTAAYVGTFAGGTPFTASNVALTLPNGKVVSPRKDGKSQSNVLLLPGAPQSSLVSRFEIPLPIGGTYTLTVGDGNAHGTIAFPITPKG